MSGFPKIQTHSNCTACGEAVSVCNCSIPMSQTLLPMQGLPKPSLPEGFETVPKDAIGVNNIVWDLDDVPGFGITKGMRLSEIILLLFQK